MTKSKRNIRKTLKALREIVENDRDETTQRIAYFAECCIRWATEDTTGWVRPEEDVHRTAILLQEQTK